MGSVEASTRTRGHTRMSSSPTSPAQASPSRHERLLSVLESVPDPRDRRGVRYPLAGVLAVAVTAVIAGCRSFAAIGQWAGQAAVDAKSNEIPAARTLLAGLELTGVTVTMDAMHTQTDTATLITTAGGDYVFTVKANMPTLHDKLKNLPWSDVPATRQTTTGRGQRVTRTIKVAAVPDWIAFPGAAQVAQLRRTVTKAGRKTVEVVYLITSANHTAAPAATLAAWVRGHWGVENRLHWVRDVR